MHVAFPASTEMFSPQLRFSFPKSRNIRAELTVAYRTGGIDESIDLSPDRGTEWRIDTGGDSYTACCCWLSTHPSAADPDPPIGSAHGARALRLSA
jgi:hypothetical protein